MDRRVTLTGDERRPPPSQVAWKGILREGLLRPSNVESILHVGSSLLI